jgi:hypothetical protein
MLLECFLLVIPPVPAENRWTKLYPALSWWAVGSQLHGVLKELWNNIFSANFDLQAAAEVVQNLLSPDDDAIQQTLNAARAKKVRNWLNHPLTASELMISCLVLRPCMSFMGFLFRSEASAAVHSVVVLMPLQSPVNTAIMFLLNKLFDVNDDFWFLFTYGHAMSRDYCRPWCLKSVWLEIIGSVFGRLPA